MPQTVHTRPVVRSHGTPTTARARHIGASHAAGERGQRVLTIRGRTAENQAPQFVHDALEELHAFISEHNLRPIGPPFALVNRTSTPMTLDVETGWPVDGPAAGSGRIHAGTLPTPITRCRYERAPDAAGSDPLTN